MNVWLTVVLSGRSSARLPRRMLFCMLLYLDTDNMSSLLPSGSSSYLFREDAAQARMRCHVMYWYRDMQDDFCTFSEHVAITQCLHRSCNTCTLNVLGRWVTQVTCTVTVRQAAVFAGVLFYCIFHFPVLLSSPLIFFLPLLLLTTKNSASTCTPV